ncbi:matrixin family metalloprotease [Pseudomonadota bacterium]
MKREFKIPGKGFAKSVEALRQELLEVTGSSLESYPIKRIFDFITLTDNNRKIQEQLIARGDLVRKQGGVFRNRARRALSERMRDIGPELEGINLYIPRHIELEFKVPIGEGVLTITPLQTGRHIFIEFDKPPAPGFGTSFVLEAIKADALGWRYQFTEEFNENSRVDIFVDLSIEAGVYAGRRSNFPALDKPVLLAREVGEAGRAAKSLGAAISRCPCDCCTPKTPNPTKCPPANARLEIALRTVILVAHESHGSILEARAQSWLAKTQSLFSQNSNLTITDAGARVIVDSAFLDIDPGECYLGQPSADTLALFDKYYGTPQDNTVVAFVLRSLSGSTVGCAAYPPARPGPGNIKSRPGFTMEYSSDEWVHAHELGHVLGLFHVDNQDNLMWEYTNITNLPPDLDGSQISKLRCSPYNRRV